MEAKANIPRDQTHGKDWPLQKTAIIQNYHQLPSDTEILAMQLVSE